MDDLARVSVWAAKHIVVLSGSRQPRVGDSHTITTVCALRCLPVGLNPNSLVVVELRLPQNKPVTRQLGVRLPSHAVHTHASRLTRRPSRLTPHAAPRTTHPAPHTPHPSPRTPQGVRHGQVDTGLGVEVLPVAAGPAADALLVLCALEPVVGRTLMDLMSFEGNQIEVLTPTRTITLHPHDHHSRLPSLFTPSPFSLQPSASSLTLTLALALTLTLTLTLTRWCA